MSVRLELAGRRFSPPLRAILLTLFGMVLFARLGVWQLDRAAYKQGLLDQFAARSHASPLDWAGLQAHGNDISAWPVALAGHYDNSRNVLLDNQLHEGVDGYHLLTVFQVSGGGAVLVDRGWVQASTDRRIMPTVPPATAIHLDGKTALPSGGLVVGSEDYQARPLRLLHLDLPVLAHALGVPLAPFLVRLDPAAPDGFGRDWPPVVTPGFGPEKCRGYAATWFSFMAVSFILLIALNTRKIEKNE